MSRRADRRLDTAEKALAGWRKVELRPIDPELLALAQGYVEADRATPGEP
jgi:hypothetical protein